MKPLTMCFAALVLLAWPTPSVQGQQSPVRLTVADALRLAHEHNPALRSAANDAEVASWQVRQAWAAFLPSLGSSLGFGAGRSTSLVGTDDFGEPVQSPIKRSYSSSSASQGISASLTLFDGGANLRRLSAQRSQARATDLAIEAQVRQVEADVELAWYRALAAQQIIGLEEQLLTSARDRLELAEALLRLAANDRVDVLGARADVANQQQSLERARGEARKAQLTLQETIGLEPGGELEQAGEVPPVFDPSGWSPDSLVLMARSQSPVIRQREAQASAYRQSAAAAGGSRLPQISISGGYSRSFSAQGYDAIGNFDLPNSGTSFGISVSLPLFSRFGPSVQVATARAAAEDAQENLRAGRLEVAAAVRSAHIDLVNAHRSLELAEQAAALGRERLELAQEKFRLGAFRFTELQSVIEAAAQAERNALTARFEFVYARIALQRQLGTVPGR